ncbi:MAG: hypothetical protein C0617_00125 [Desulfuromonas sp.]|uniref:hypothetical protein n=1 Tax=Desulfuromonas sp. TaxID=892 RepID=UPI000CB72E27|nr:hypothetical protein [Desulfuromonas sp.]PLX86654.1 MAG: hypothetical protein C0617_00125 [Desulfuromonas sp.]
MPTYLLLLGLLLLPTAGLYGAEIAPSAKSDALTPRLGGRADNLTPNLASAQMETARPKGMTPKVRIDWERDITSVCFKTGSTITSYLGAGLGATAEKPEPDVVLISNEEVDEEALAYQLGVGFDCELDKATSLALGYRYKTDSLLVFDIPSDGGDSPGDGHNISLGLKVAF